MRRLTDGERDVLAELEADTRELTGVPEEVADLDDGGFDRDEWCPPDTLPPFGADDPIPF